MSIVKDLLLLSVFIIVTVKYILIYREYRNQQDYFIDTLSHDLRVSAIAQIRGLELIEKTYGKSELTEEIGNSCKYSLDMISMLLKTFQYKNNIQVLNRKNFNLAKIVALACQNLNSIANEKGIKLYNCSHESVNIYADENEILKTIITLLSTAIYYSKKDERIVICVQKIKNNVEFSIIYKGKSLSDEECKRMFCNKPRFSTVGHGIKMHLCKKVIDFHKGSIQVKNCGENINTFTFTLPDIKTENSAKVNYAKALQLFEVL